jgi:hypothetical protein
MVGQLWHFFDLFLNNVVDIVEVEPLDIEAAVVASRKFCQFVCCLGEGSFVKGGSLQLEGQTQTAFVCRVGASDHQNLWSTPTVVDLPV